MLYILLTEDKPDYRANVCRIVDGAYPGWTFAAGFGRWQGKSEASLIIGIIAPSSDAPKIEALARAINAANGQECTLVLALEACEQFITGREE